MTVIQTVFTTEPITRIHRGSYTPTVATQFLTLGETYKAPPVVGEGEVAVLDVQRDEWNVVVDKRGTEYYLPDGSKHTISVVGGDVPVGGILTPPATKYHTHWDTDSKSWIFDYDKCREDLYKQIEEEKRKAQDRGITIGGVLWDSDMKAEIRLTQIWLVLNNNPNFITEDFYANSHTPIVMNLQTHIGWQLASTHNLRNIFKWRGEMRAEIADVTNVTQLMSYFNTMRFIPTEYEADGTPIEG